MRRRISRSGRSPRDWAVRGAVASLLAVLGYFSLSYTSAAILKRGNLALAHRLGPADGRITAALAERSFAEKPERHQQSRSARLARSALTQDPTVVQAVGVLGLQAHLRGDIGLARRLFAYSQRLSRRHLQTQLWAIEDAVSRDDIPKVLSHYDTALRTSRSAPDVLFPVLTAAVADPAVRVALTRTLTAKPAWGEAFLNHVSGRGEPLAVVRMLGDLKRSGVAVSAESEKGLINILVSRDQLDEAWRFYTSVRSPSRRDWSRDPRFTANLPLPSFLDWSPIEGPISTAIQAGLFDFAAPASVGGPMLQQMQLLRPGAYDLIGHSAGIDQPESAWPYWLLSCRADGRELGRVPVPSSTVSRGQFRGRFVVPGDCPVQVLTLIARPANTASGVSGQIDYVQLRPIG